MNKRRRQKVLATAGPLMRPGERVELVAYAKVGSVPIKKNAAAFGVSVAIGIATGGIAIAAFTQSTTYIVLTDQQILFFESNQSTGSPGRHRASVPRSAVSPGTAKSGVFVKIQLDIEGSDKALKLSFPPIPPSARAAGRAFVAALEATVPHTGLAQSQSRR